MSPAMLLTLIPLIPKLAKAFYASKAFWPAVTTGGMLGVTAMGEKGRAEERELTKEQLDIQKLLQSVSAEANKKLTTESKARTEKMINTLMKSRKEEMLAERENQMMQTFMGLQGQRMGMVTQAIQGLSQTPYGGGMTGVMRQGF